MSSAPSDPPPGTHPYLGCFLPHHHHSRRVWILPTRDHNSWILRTGREEHCVDILDDIINGCFTPIFSRNYLKTLSYNL